MNVIMHECVNGKKRSYNKIKKIKMKLIIHKSYDEISTWTAEYIVKRINEFNPTEKRDSLYLNGNSDKVIKNKQAMSRKGQLSRHVKNERKALTRYVYCIQF